jgi:hypothetical protein
VQYFTAQDLKCNGINMRVLKVILLFLTATEFIFCAEYEQIDSLEPFYHWLLIENHFSYTVLGKKPISQVGFFNVSCYMGYSRAILRKHIDLKKISFIKKKWSQFKEQGLDKNLSPNFIIKEEKQGSITSIYLINIELVKKTIQVNLPLFQSSLKTTKSADEITSDVINSQFLYVEGLKGRGDLYGILFGYPVEDCIKFYQYHDKRQKIYYPPKPIMNSPYELSIITCPPFMTFSDTIDSSDHYTPFEVQRRALLKLACASMIVAQANAVMFKKNDTVFGVKLRVDQ